MLHVCPSCRDPGVEKAVEPTGDGVATVACSACGREYSIPYRPLYTIEGAPGVGKSTTAGLIAGDVGLPVVEGDAFVDLVGGELSWASTCELSLRLCATVHAAGAGALYVGGGVPYDLDDAPETRYFARLERCALVCGDDDYGRRLAGRPHYRANPERIDEHRPHNRWYRERGPAAGIETVNTTAHDPEGVADRVLAWLRDAGAPP